MSNSPPFWTVCVQRAIFAIVGLILLIAVAALQQVWCNTTDIAKMKATSETRHEQVMESLRELKGDVKEFRAAWSKTEDGR